MDKRKIAKFATNQTLMTVATATITKTIFAVFPQTASYPKTTALVGSIGGYVVADKLEPETNTLVDRVFDKIEARKTKKTT